MQVSERGCGERSEKGEEEKKGEKVIRLFRVTDNATELGGRRIVHRIKTFEE